MNTPLNNDTQQKARELARKITVAHDLDPEIQEELYGHIEDKLLAFKSGEERKVRRRRVAAPKFVSRCESI